MAHIGRVLHHYSCLDSTNARALELAGDLTNAGLAILADEQTAGRGQYGRTWSAPPGSSALLSVLVFPPPELRRPVLLTAWAAVSVCELIQQIVDLPAKIKWPNDVLLQGKKVCGILIEQRTLGDHVATVVGIGLNINQPREFFEEANLPLGGSLAERTGRTFDRDLVSQRLLEILDREYGRLLQGDQATLEGCWKQHLNLLGKTVAVETHGEAAVVRGHLVEAGFASVTLVGEQGNRLDLQPEKIKQMLNV